MMEITIRLTLTSDMLGAVRRTVNRQILYTFPRDAEGRAMFLASLWRPRVAWAAKVAQRCQQLVDKILWGSVVDGVMKKRRRVVRVRGTRECYALHECFRATTDVGFTAVLPDGMTPADLSELLTLIGTYRGVSPFSSETECFGLFVVKSVLPVIRVQGQE